MSYYVNNKWICLLTSIQMSGSGQLPFAILRAANGQNLNSIGRGMFIIRTITIVGHSFRDADLVHNLLGIAPQYPAVPRCIRSTHSTCSTLQYPSAVPTVPGLPQYPRILCSTRQGNHLISNAHMNKITSNGASSTTASTSRCTKSTQH
jgi:hypothetical protein